MAELFLSPDARDGTLGTRCLTGALSKPASELGTWHRSVAKAGCPGVCLIAVVTNESCISSGVELVSLEAELTCRSREQVLTPRCRILP